MKPRILVLCGTFALVCSAPAADPAWWADRGVTNAAPASNLSPATIGQAKHVAAMALAELQTRLPAGDFAALQADVAAIVNLAVPQSQTEFDAQMAVLANGQLKAMAKPFYDRLRTLDGAWLNLRMYQAGVRVLEPGAPSPFTYSPYPWTESSGDDSNKAVATVGQLKAVFSLAFESWVSPGAYDPLLPWGGVDTDGDGLSDVTELAIGTSPSVADTDSDGYLDGVDFFPLDSTLWNHPGGSAGDSTGPAITLIEPVGAVPVP